MSSPKDEPYVGEFRRRFNRDPTPEDIDRISSKLVAYAEQRRRTVEDRREQNLSFSGMMEGIKEVGLSVSQTDVHSAMDTLLQEEREAVAEKGRSDMRGRKRRAAFAATLAVGAIVGMAGGTGYAAYRAKYDPAVQSEVREYEARRAELEERFFGPLPSLTQRTTSTLTPRERELMLRIYLGPNISSQLSDQTSMFYQTTLEGITIEARKMFRLNSRGLKREQLLLIKRDANDGGILSGYLYRETCFARCNDLADLVRNNNPYISVIFDGEGTRTIYHADRRILQTAGDKTQRIEGESIEVYTGAARTLARDFMNLYNRGPGRMQIPNTP